MTGLKDVSLGYAESFSDLEEFMRWLSQSREVLAVDTETSGLDAYERGARIRLVQFGDEMTGWAINFERWPGIAEEVLTRYTGRLAFHNFPFDAKFLALHSSVGRTWWDRVDDTMIAARVEDSTRPAALKWLSRKFIDKNAARGQDLLDQAMIDNKWTWDTVPYSYPGYTVYSAMDVVLTARMWHIFKNNGVLDSDIYQLENPVSHTTTRMELRGARVDLSYTENKYQELDGYVEAMLVYGVDKYGIKLTSPTQLGNWLQEHGAPPLKYTNAGLYSTDAEVMETLSAEGWEIADDVLKIRKAGKLASTYFRNIIELNREEYLHCQINSRVARTGRMSIQSPALQTLPKRDKTVRRAFIPDSDEHVILSSDLDQVELRIFASLCQADALIDMFAHADEPGGTDVFTQIGRDIYADPTMVKGDPRRDTVKTFVYSMLYGAGVEKQAASAGVPVATMRNISNKFKELYPQISQFQSRVGSEVQTLLKTGNRPFVTNPYGDVLYVDEDKPYTGVNYLIQSSAAAAFKTNLLNLENAGLGQHMIVPVHDEIVLSVPKDDLADVAPLVKECMTTATNLFAVPVPAGISIGSNWGAMEDYDV